MADYRQDDFELTKCQMELVPEVKYECENNLRTWTYEGMTFDQQDTTTCDDIMDNNTVILRNYGCVTTTHVMDPSSVNIALYADKQIKGQNSGEKPTGFIALFDSEGGETSRFNLERLHMEKYTIGPFNAKSKRPMLQHGIWRMEKLTRA